MGLSNEVVKLASRPRDARAGHGGILLETRAISINQSRETIAGLHGVEQFSIEEDALGLGAFLGVAEALLPFLERRRSQCGGEFIVHLVEQFRSPRRSARQRCNLLDKLHLFRTEHGMAQMMAFANDAGKACSGLADRLGKEKCRGRYGKARRLDAEMGGDELIEHLIILAPADAVHELIGDEQPKDGGEG
jgi:hypothetical protein